MCDLWVNPIGSTLELCPHLTAFFLLPKFKLSSSFFLDVCNSFLTTHTDYKLVLCSFFSAQHIISPFCSQILLSTSLSHIISLKLFNGSVHILSRTKLHHLVIALLLLSFIFILTFYPTLILFQSWCSSNIQSTLQLQALNLVFSLLFRYIWIFDKVSPFRKTFPNNY